MKLETIESAFYLFLIGLIIVAVCYAFYNLFSQISEQFGIASVIIVGLVILCDCYYRTAPF